MIIKTGTIVDADQARSLLERFGTLGASFDGSLPTEISAADIEDADIFRVVINYGCAVQLHLIDEATRVQITLAQLFGKCAELVEDDVLTAAQWYAEI